MAKAKGTKKPKPKKPKGGMMYRDPGYGVGTGEHPFGYNTAKF